MAERLARVTRAGQRRKSDRGGSVGELDRLEHDALGGVTLE